MNEKPSMLERIARLALRRAKGAEDKVSQVVVDKAVHGMDIYIQDTEPVATGDYVWINTAGINSIVQ